MAYDPQVHHRRSIPLRGYDYSRAGAYFVTIRTHERECLFGEVVDGEMRLDEYGHIVEGCWHAIPRHLPTAELDAFVIMQNHLHGILVITAADVTGDIATDGTRQQFGKPTARSLPTIVSRFKAAVTKEINETRGLPGTPIWQRNYYEHIIRNEVGLGRVRCYIEANPLRWASDDENPAHVRAR